VRFILYTPRGVKTGGPEALHQLHHAIKTLGYESYLLPTWGTSTKKVVLEYDIYNPIYINWRDLNRDDILIIPEYFKKIPCYLSKRIGAIAYWWLSVDNSPFADQTSEIKSPNISWTIRLESVERQRKLSIRKFKNIPNFIKFETKILMFKVKQNIYEKISSEIVLNTCLHIFQSHYAREFVFSNLQFNGLMVSDYTRELPTRPIKESMQIQKVKKGGFTVAYNSSKGLANILALKNYLPQEIVLVPLQGLTHQQLINTFEKVDLYLDLGNLPGKDRLPREAILSGCPVMVSKLGAGQNLLDFPTSNEYKLDIGTIKPTECAQRIIAILELGKLENLKRQETFLQSVLNEKEIFYTEVSAFIERCRSD
jgi:hypothetical protein